MSAVILMYHRVCERREARPWFARGTAVTPSAFAKQMMWLTRHFDVVPLRELLSDQERDAPDCGHKRPLASLTFDDGYVDVISGALPVCRDLGIVGTVFPVCGHLAGHGRYLWFDAFYQLLQAASDPPQGQDHASVGGIPLSTWVRGAEKEALQHASPEARHMMLKEFGERLGVSPTDGRTKIPSGRTELYLSDAELAQLVDLGWTVGGHGTTHSRLTSLDDTSLHEELAQSVMFVRARCEGDVVFAYPDGFHDARVRAAAAALGVRWALTVSPGSARPLQDPLAIPRYHCRGDDEVPSPALARPEI